MKLQYRILIIVLACLAAISCTQTPKSGKRIVFIGDSITDGNWGCIYNYKRASSERSHTDMNHSYVYIIASYCQSRWSSRNYAFFNRGFSGQALHRTRTFLLDMGRHTPDPRRAQTHGGPLA